MAASYRLAHIVEHKSVIAQQQTCSRGPSKITYALTRNREAVTQMEPRILCRGRGTQSKRCLPLHTDVKALTDVMGCSLDDGHTFRDVIEQGEVQGVELAERIREDALRHQHQGGPLCLL